MKNLRTTPEVHISNQYNVHHPAGVRLSVDSVAIGIVVTDYISYLSINADKFI